MTSEKIARAFVRCKYWDWLPGMAVFWDPPAGAAGQQWMPTSARLVDVDAGILPELGLLYTGHAHFKRGAHPVVGDPATLGCVLALCRNAWGDEGLCVRQEHDYEREGKSTWHVTGGKLHGGTFNRMAEVAYPSEAHALLACLEARDDTE